MNTQDDTPQYRLKLKEGDLVQATVTGISGDDVQVDTSSWSNVVTAALVDIGDNTSITPGTDIYAKVKTVENQSATLTQQRGVYRRNHLPGDEVRMRAVKPVSSTLNRAELDQLRNLDTVYIAGVSIGADVKGKLSKIRAGTAIAIPSEIHDPGFSPGREVNICTVAGSKEAELIKKDGSIDSDETRENQFSIRLTDVAKATGTATAKVIGTDSDGIRGELLEYPEQLPTSGDRFETTVKQGKKHSKIKLGESDLQIKVQFDHPCPGRGTALIKLRDCSKGIFDADLIRYTDPSIREGKQYDATIYKIRGQAKINIDGREIPVQLVNEPSTTGEGTVNIVEITDSIYGRVIGDIEQIAIDESHSSDVDMTNLGRF